MRKILQKVSAQQITVGPSKVTHRLDRSFIYCEVSRSSVFEIETTILLSSFKSRGGLNGKPKCKSLFELKYYSRNNGVDLSLKFEHTMV